jgi:hypothetical protein
MSFFQGIKGKILICKELNLILFFRASIFINKILRIMVRVLSSVVLLAFLASMGLTLLILGCALAQ